jgi:hypothetical protein
MLARLMKGTYNFTQFYIDTSTTLEDLESELIVILWSQNKKL